MTQGGEHKQRTCIACRTKGDKGALYRVVRDAQGCVSFDPTGRAAGRGAYVCSSECLNAARSSRKFERALRTKIAAEDYERIVGEFARVIGEAVER